MTVHLAGLRSAVLRCNRVWQRPTLGLIAIIVVIVVNAGSASPAFAHADPEPPSEAQAGTPRQTVQEPLRDLGLIHRGGSDTLVQELWLLGRYHGQLHRSDGDDASDEDWENRRFRVGAQARLLRNLTLHAQMVSGNDLEPFYNGFTELWAGWRFHDGLVLTIGQQKHRFTHDRNVSSRYINYLERGLLTNMFSADYTPAVTLSGRHGPWNYYGGVFANKTSRNMKDAFTNLDSGHSLLGSVTRDIGAAVGTDSAFVSVSFVHSDATRDATNLNRFENGLATALILTQGSTSLVVEGTVGTGSANGNAVGVNVQPSYFFTRRVQLVGRYQVAGGTETDTLTAQRRYEREVGLRTGDLYNAVYAGLNLHLAEHRIKLMSGVEYARLSGRDAVTTSVALRMFWGPHSRGPFPMAQVLGR